MRGPKGRPVLWEQFAVIPRLTSHKSHMKWPGYTATSSLNRGTNFYHNTWRGSRAHWRPLINVKSESGRCEEGDKIFLNVTPCSLVTGSTARYVATGLRLCVREKKPNGLENLSTIPRVILWSRLCSVRRQQIAVAGFITLCAERDAQGSGLQNWIMRLSFSCMTFINK